MKKYILPVLICILFASCDKKSKIENEIEEIPLEQVKVERLDKIFYETPINDFPKVRNQYSYIFQPDVPDAVYTSKIQDPIWREVYTEVQKKYSNFEPQKSQLEDLFKHIKFYFPKSKTPKVITLINEMDYNTKTIYADSLVFISLELYLGKDHKFYQFPAYIKENFTERQMMPDIVSSFALRKIAPPKSKTLLEEMIYAGKELYLKDLLIPEFTDAEKIGYTPEQITWCQANEGYMWSYFVEKKMLYDSDSKLPGRFINLAPFSKFYLEIDNETPGRVGTWVGWQIVRSFMQNNEVSLQQLLQMDATEIFNKSKYKPKKDE
ncbi:MAG: gliding motility lipoprotein GldB [Bacteroidota bacterium]